MVKLMQSSVLRRIIHEKADVRKNVNSVKITRLRL